MNLSNQDIDILEESLHQFIFSEYEDIPKSEKIRLNDLALQIINKLKNKELDFNANHLSIMSYSLYKLISFVENSSMTKDSDYKNFLNRARFLYNSFEKILNSL